jgi:hypothetical protein
MISHLFPQSTCRSDRLHAQRIHDSSGKMLNLKRSGKYQFGLYILLLFETLSFVSAGGSFFLFSSFVYSFIYFQANGMVVLLLLLLLRNKHAPIPFAG